MRRSDDLPENTRTSWTSFRQSRNFPDHEQPGISVSLYRMVQCPDWVSHVTTSGHHVGSSRHRPPRLSSSWGVSAHLPNQLSSSAFFLFMWGITFCIQKIPYDMGVLGVSEPHPRCSLDPGLTFAVTFVRKCSMLELGPCVGVVYTQLLYIAKGLLSEYLSVLAIE